MAMHDLALLELQQGDAPVASARAGVSRPDNEPCMQLGTLRHTDLNSCPAALATDSMATAPG